MRRQMTMLEHFHNKFGVVVGKTPEFRDAELRANLIEEEAKETVEAIRGRNMIEAIDGMIDTLYVIFGTFVAFGVDPMPFFEEVHATNMAKEGGAKREDGKILKPAGWKPPRIELLLRQQQMKFGVYQHYKGALYEAYELITDTSAGSDGDLMVRYAKRGEGVPGSSFVKRLEEFHQEVEWPDGSKGPRFKFMAVIG